VDSFSHEEEPTFGGANVAASKMSHEHREQEKPMNVLETDRLLLRHLTPEDRDDLAALHSDPDFMRFFGGPQSPERAREHVGGMIEWAIEQYAERGYCFYATVHKPDGRLIGRCGLLSHRIDGVEEAEVAYGIAPAYWGRGLATEAAQAIKEYGFRQFGFPRLCSIVDKENLASRRVAEKNGMRIEKSIQFHGHDCFLYVIERSSP
jgi:ribosomal-protein-alanine N-acetyltransferase